MLWYTISLKIISIHTVQESVNETGADASMIMVPPAFAAEAITEAAAAGIKIIICITEGIPVLDMVNVRACLEHYPETRLVESRE